MKRLLLVVAACGGSSATRPPEPKSPAPPPKTAQQAAAISPEVFCERFVALRDSGCEAFASITMTREECVSELGAASSDPAEAAFMNQTGQCVVGFKTCGDVVACLA